MKYVFLLSFVAPTCMLTISSEPTTKCVDDGNYKLENGKLACKSMRRAENLRLKYCNYDKVAKACVVTCGNCCYDDPSFKIKLNKKNKKERSCRWIGRKKASRKSYCFRFVKNYQVKAACPGA